MRARLLAMFMVLVCAPVFTLAQLSPQVQKAADWLAAQVQSVAVSGEASSVANPVQVRGETVQTLRLLARLPSPLADAVYAHDDGLPQVDTETLARRVLAGAAQSRDLAALLQSLRERRNADGGFGGGPGVASAALDTAWALLALAQAGQAAATDAVAARRYLAAQLDVQGALTLPAGGIRGGASLQLFHSALASLALQTHADSADAVRRLSAYLSAQQASDGGWAGDTVITAWVLQALSAVSSDGGMKSAAASFLQARQSGDGSWSGDPYVTAVALRALLAPGAAGTAGQSGLGGTVFDALSGLPLEGASVAATQGTATPVAGVTDAQGRFSLLDLASGATTVTVSRAGYQSQSRAVTLNAAQTLDLGALRLQPSAATGLVRGVVSTTDGLPIAGAAVQLTGGATPLNALADTQGRYEFSAVPPGNYSLTASFAGFQNAAAAASLQAGQTLLFSPSLLRVGESGAGTGQFFGQVVNAGDATPIAGAAVLLTDTASGATQTLSASADGRFALTLNPGSYTARYTAQGFSAAEQRFVLTAGTNVDAGRIALALVKTSSDVRGMVRDSAGQAIAGATVAVVGATPALSAQSASDGRYFIANAGTTSITLRASAVGFNSQSVQLQTPVPTELQHDFALVPQAGGAVRIDTLTLTPTSLPGRSLLQGTATLRNSGTAAATVTLGFQVLNDRNEPVASGGVLDAAGQPLGTVTLAAAATQGLRLQWNSAQFAPGPYRLVLRAVEPGSSSRDNPLGNLLVETAAAFALTGSSVFTGALTINPPVMHATAVSSAAFAATLQNSGNQPLAADSYRLQVKDTKTGATALSRDVQGAAMPVSALATVDFGSWTPPAAGGDFSVTVTSASDPSRGLVQGKLYVGEAASGSFTLDRTVVPTGTQKLRATVQVKGEDVTGAITDPLAGPIKAAIQKSVTYGDLNASNWVTGNQCLGCHVVTQALVGGEGTRRFTTYNELYRNNLFNSITSYRRNDGALLASHPEYVRAQTTLGLWALNAWHNRDEIAATLSAAASYLAGTQSTAGSWSTDYAAGWWGSGTANTALNLKSFTEVVDTLKRVPAPVDYTRQTILSGGGLNGTYSLAKNAAGQVLVANYIAGTVMAVSANGSAQTLMTGLSSPYGILGLADGSLLVSTRNGLLRRASDGSVSTYSTLTTGSMLLPLPDGRLLSASSADNKIYEIPAGGGAAKVFATSSLFNGPTGLALDTDGSVLVANYYARNLLRVRPDKTVEVIDRWTNGNPRVILRQGNGWLVSTTTGVYRYNDHWQLERIGFEQSDGLVVLDDGTIVTGNGASLLSRLVPQAVDSAGRIAVFTTAINKATNWLLVDANTSASSNMELALRLIGLGAAQGFNAGTPLADTLQAKMAQIAATLRSRQLSDGGWGAQTFNASDSMVTAMVGYALDSLHPPADDPVVRKAIQFLLSRQQADGSWISENGILGTRLAATTWVEIWLPIALDRIGGIDTQLTLRFPANVTLSNPSVAATSTTAQSAGGATYQWALNAVTATGRDLQFDLTFADLAANETRPAASAAALTFNNTFTNQALEAAIAIPAVRASAFLDVGVRTDLPSYGAEQPVIVTAPVVNGGAAPAQASVRLSVLSPDGRVLAELGSFAAGTIPAGATQPVSALWNTGSVLAASGYQARAVLLSAAGQELGTALAPFAVTVGAGQAASARIVTDRATYAPTDSVRLTDTLRNLSANGLLDNLGVRTEVRDATGALIWSVAQPLAQLVGGASTDLLYDLPLARVPAGLYSARLTLADSQGALLASAGTSFTVSDSAGSGAGLSGTLAAQPREVPAGDPVSLAWSLRNDGNAAFTQLPVVLRILDPTGGQEVAALPSAVDLALAGTLQRTQAWTTDDAWIGKSLVAALTVQLADGRRVTLAQDSFRVIEPPIKVELGVHGQAQARVLALVSCPPGDNTALPDDPSCLGVRVQGLRTALTALGVVHTIVTTQADFERELRSGRYNTVWVSGGSQKLGDPLVKEVRALVQRGGGLVLDGVHDSRNQLLHPAAGVAATGKLGSVDRPLEPVAGGLFAPGVVPTLGRPTVFSIDSATVQARFTAADGKGAVPAILTNTYGAGRSALFAFDLVQRLALVPADAAQLDLVRRALGGVANAADPPLQYATTAAAIEVFNSGTQAAEVWVQATLQPGLRYIGASAEASGTQPDAQGVVSWRLQLQPDERRTLVLRVAVDVPGPVTVPVTVQAARIGSSSYRSLGSASLVFTSRSAAVVAQDAVAAINALLPTSASEANAKRRALGDAQQAQAALGQGQPAQALAAWVDAADELLRIDTVDAQAARTAVAQAIGSTELLLGRQGAQP